jgi:hypothetical protein
MTRSWLAGARAQLRHLSVGQLVVDIAMTSVVGLLGMLVLLLASQHAFDALSFEGRLQYRSRTAADHTHLQGVTVTTESSISVAVLSADRYDSPERASADLTESAQPRVWRYRDDAHASIGAVLGRNVSAGLVAPGEALLDEASAARLSVAPGDTVVVVADGRHCPVRLSGLIRPAPDVDRGYGAHLLVLPIGVCGQVFADSVDTGEPVRFSDEPPAPPAISWAERIWYVAARTTDVHLSGLLLPVLFIGLGLWAVVTLRMAFRVRRQVALAAELLFDLGHRPTVVRATHVVVVSALVTASACGAAWGARELLWHIASLYMQTSHWVTTAVVFAAVAIAVAIISARRAGKSSAARPNARSGPALHSDPLKGDS